MAPFFSDMMKTIRRLQTHLGLCLGTEVLHREFQPTPALPGTPLYERLQKESGWYMNDGGWSRVTAGKKPSYVPRHDTEQLAQGCRWARARFPQLGRDYPTAAFEAHLGSLDNLAVYLASNWVSRREIRAKLRLQEAAMRILFVKPIWDSFMDSLTTIVAHGTLTFACWRFHSERHEVYLCDDRFDPVPYGEHGISWNHQ